jgi:ATP-dependent protease ClpP protease subunit
VGRIFWQFRAEASPDSSGGADLLLYGPIGGDAWGWLFDDVTPKQFQADLAALGDIKELRVFINSEGGDVFAGQAIHSMLQRHPARVTVHIDGLAASIASVVAMAGDRILMPRNAMMMIHNPWSVGIGDAREFRKIADTLDQIRESIIAAYQSKTDMGRQPLMNLLNAETWMTAQEAVDMGFADEIEESKQIAASLLRPGVVVIGGQQLDLTRFSNVRLPDLREAGQKELTERDAERVLREGGFSIGRSKTILARGWESDSLKDAAIPSHTTEKAPEDEAWERPTLSDFTGKNWGDLSDSEKNRIARHFVWSDSALPPDTFTDLGGGHHRPTSSGMGAVVWRAVSSGRMQQASWSDDPGVRRHLASHYHQFDKKAPWEEQDSDLAMRLASAQQISSYLAGRQSAA